VLKGFYDDILFFLPPNESTEQDTESRPAPLLVSPDPIPRIPIGEPAVSFRSRPTVLKARPGFEGIKVIRKKQNS
jgi:hypothetical protein